MRLEEIHQIRPDHSKMIHRSFIKTSIIYLSCRENGKNERKNLDNFVFEIEKLQTLCPLLIIEK